MPDDDFMESLMFDDDDDGGETNASGSTAQSSPRGASSGPSAMLAQRIHSAPSAGTAAWDVPLPGPPLPGRAGSAASMARSMPRPITNVRRGLSARMGDGDCDEFVPPHLTASMVEPQMCESLSTAKGAAGLRLRSTTLRRTGYLDGRMGMPGAPVRLPSS